MGLSKYTYIGLFFVVKYKKDKVQKFKTTWVSASGNVHTKKIKFDPMDGTPVSEQKEPYFEEGFLATTVSDLKGEVAEKYKDAFFDSGYSGPKYHGKDIWLWNWGSNKYGESYDDESIIDLTNVDQQKCIDAFVEEHEEILILLRENFDMFEVKYGVVVYYS